MRDPSDVRSGTDPRVGKKRNSRKRRHQQEDPAGGPSRRTQHCTGTVTRHCYPTRLPGTVTRPGYPALLPGTVTRHDLPGTVTRHDLPGTIPTRYTLLPAHLSVHPAPCTPPGYTSVHHRRVCTSPQGAGPGSGGATRPWALILRLSLGERTLATLVSLNLFTFVSLDSFSFPDHPRSITRRSDGVRATRLPAAYG